MQLGCIFPAFISQVCSDHLGMKFAQLLVSMFCLRFTPCLVFLGDTTIVLCVFPRLSKIKKYEVTITFSALLKQKAIVPLLS